MAESLEHQHLLAGTPEVCSSDKSVVSTPDHDGVITRGQFR
jgi:hypothetical protein